MVVLKDIMRSPVTVDYTMSVSDVARIMVKKDISSVLVEKNGDIVGIVTEKDIIKRVVARGVDATKTDIMSIMSHPLITAEADTDPVKASEIMSKYKIRRLVVTENNKIIGIFSATQIVKHSKFIYDKRKAVYNRQLYTR